LENREGVVIAAALLGSDVLSQPSLFLFVPNTILKLKGKTVIMSIVINIISQHHDNYIVFKFEEKQ
jgi:uncharacterized circularly permuted ATP-grasp superfamily protein